MHKLDLGIAGRTAIVCGSTEGLGHACATALADAGVDVVINGRTPDKVTQVADALERRLGRPVLRVAADVTLASGREALLAVCPAPDIVVCNSAGPPPGHFEDWSEVDWERAVAQNMIAPIMLVQQVLGPMRARRWGRIIAITSAAVKAPLPLLGLSNGARSGLTGFISGLAREVASDGVTINTLLPSHFATGRLYNYAGVLGSGRGLNADAVLDEMAASNPSGRLGHPDEFGATCAFLASAHAGYITGQHILLDGGAYPGTF